MRRILLLLAVLILTGMPAVWAADMERPVETEVRLSVSPGTASPGDALTLNAEVWAQSMAAVESGNVDFYLIDDATGTERLVGAAAVKENLAKTDLKPQNNGYPAQAGTYTLVARYRAAGGIYAGSEARVVLNLDTEKAGPAGLITGGTLADECSVLLAGGALLLLIILLFLWQRLLRNEDNELY